MGLQETTPQQELKPAYPVYPLDEALRVAKAIVDLGGARTPVKKEMLAKHMGYAETGPSFVQRLAAARSFGLINGRGEYGLTETARRYFFPSSETDKAAAGFQALSSPKVFEVIVARFHGHHLPPNEIIGNIMHTEVDVPSSWKDKAAALFIKSAKSIGALDNNGNLKSLGTESGGRPVDSKGSESSATPKIENEAIELHAEPGNHTHTLPLANQRRVTINAPLDVTQNEIRRIQTWIEVTLLVDWRTEQPP